MLTRCLLVRFHIHTDAVGIEEWLYWTYLLRTVHAQRVGGPAAARLRGRSYLARTARQYGISGTVVTWIIAISVNAIVQIVVVFAGTGTDPVLQTIRLFITVGVIGLITA